jgi:hypothetical protein
MQRAAGGVEYPFKGRSNGQSPLGYSPLPLPRSHVVGEGQEMEADRRGGKI